MKVNYSTTLKWLVLGKYISLKTYKSLLHDKTYSSKTTIRRIKEDFNTLQETIKLDNDSLQELKSLFEIVVELSPYTTLKELLDNGYISVRTYNALCYYNAELNYTDKTTVALVKKEFTNLSTLLKLRNFGQKSYFELSSVLSSISVDEDILVDGLQVDEYTLNVINSSYDSTFGEDNEFTSYIKSIYITVEDLHFKILNNYSTLYSIYENFDLKGNIIVRQYILDYIRSVISKSPSVSAYKIYVQAEKYLSENINNFSYKDKYNYFLDDFKKEYIYKYYVSICDEAISVRCKHFLEKNLPNFEDLLSFIDKSKESLLNELSSYINRTSKTLIEIIELCSKVREKIKEVEGCDNKTLSLLSLKRKYPFLVMKQREFVIDYLNQNGSPPHFYLLYQYLYAICCSTSEENNCVRIFCSYNGLFDGVEKSLDEIASEKHLSRERIRQLSSVEATRKVLTKEFSIDISEYTGLLNKPYFFCDDKVYLELKNTQNLNFDFRVFGILFCLYGDCRYINYKGFEVVVSNQLFKLKLKSDPFEKTLETILYQSSLRRPKDEMVSLYNFLPKDFKYFEEQKNLLFYALKQINPLQIEFEDDIIIFKQNCIDVTVELVDILEENGRPMFLQELYTAFKSKFPEHKYDNPNKLRANIKRPIKAIGKQSRYALEYWDDICWGSIRDLLIGYLEESDIPVHIDKLVEIVLCHYPNTNVKNITSSLSSDELDRFVQFNGGFYGLESKLYPEKFIRTSIVRRYSFEERLKMYADFIETYHRFPLSNGGEQEASLQRWCNNVFAGALSITKEDIDKLNAVIEYYDKLNYPRNAYEADFLNKCHDYKAFVLENHCLPSQTQGEELYWWIRRSKYSMDSFTDKRRDYFIELLSYISSFGFSI